MNHRAATPVTRVKCFREHPTHPPLRDVIPHRREKGRPGLRKRKIEPKDRRQGLSGCFRESPLSQTWAVWRSRDGHDRARRRRQTTSLSFHPFRPTYAHQGPFLRGNRVARPWGSRTVKREEESLSTSMGVDHGNPFDAHLSAPLAYSRSNRAETGLCEM